MNLRDLIVLRKQLKVELIELAALTGLPDSYLSQIEEGTIQPLSNDLARIEKILMKVKADPDRQHDLNNLSDDDVQYG